MSHYCALRRAEEAESLARQRKNDINALCQMDRAMADLANMLSYFDNTEMRKAFKTIRKEYVSWQYNNDLLVRDPNIIIEVLKDDK